MGHAVLCGVDDETPPAVCEVAADLAARLGSRLLLAHVAQVPVSHMTSRADRERDRHARHRQVERILRRADGPRLAKAADERRVVVGQPVSGFLELAETEDAELIVVGTRGRGPVAAAVLGSFSRAVARHAPCPVVVVPPSAADADGHTLIRRQTRGSVVCGVSTAGDPVRTLRFASALASRMDERLLVVRENGASSLGELARELPAEAEVVDLEGALGPGLEAVAHAEAAHLAVIAGSSKGPLRSLLEGSPREGLLRHSPTPVTLLPDAADTRPGSEHDGLSEAS